jgi:DNA polymerase-1
VINGKPGVDAGDYRKVAKSIVLGLLNGKTEYSIHQDLSAAGLNLSLDQVRSLISKFHEYFSGLKDWQDRVLIKAVDDGYAQTALGRRRYLEKFIKDPSAVNKIKNFPIQGTAADGFKTALCQLNRRFQELGLDAHLVLTLFDEIVIEVREEVVEQVLRIIDECLKEAFADLIPNMPFELDMRISDSWTS